MYIYSIYIIQSLTKKKRKQKQHTVIHNKSLWSATLRIETHQVLSVEGDLIPPGGDKLIVAVEDPAVHILVSPRIEEGFKPTQPEGKGNISL